MGPERIQGQFAGVLLPNAVITLIARFAGGEITSKVLVNFGYALPAVVATTSLGVYLSIKVSSRTFDRLVLALLALTGAWLLLS
ncbi:hypothetical protein [Aggregatilinea lenta]|uniref:hypothetical protein n=1 Tax=Aggregatilinea lenta TaxID=913108 RepID=UPI000E5AC0A5|nr:hypothetical protein [Aggregatilinea lenta]